MNLENGENRRFSVRISKTYYSNTKFIGRIQYLVYLTINKWTSLVYFWVNLLKLGLTFPFSLRLRRFLSFSLLLHDSTNTGLLLGRRSRRFLMNQIMLLVSLERSSSSLHIGVSWWYFSDVCRSVRRFTFFSIFAGRSPFLFSWFRNNFWWTNSWVTRLPRNCHLIQNSMLFRMSLVKSFENLRLKSYNYFNRGQNLRVYPQ